MQRNDYSHEYYIEGLARVFDPNRHFYNCSRCLWSGDELVYAGITSAEPVRTDVPYGQGCCPGCGKPFDGCLHESVLEPPVERDEW